MRGSGLQDRKLVRVGETVRRPAGPWTESVHHLLRSLRQRGFDLAPEPLGIDAAGREILSYIHGRVQGWPFIPEILTVGGARKLGELAFRLRSALASYECPPARDGSSQLAPPDRVRRCSTVTWRRGTCCGVTTAR